MMIQNQTNKSEAKKLAKLVKRSRVEPVWFFQNILNIKSNELDKRRNINWDLDEWQIELVESVADVYRYLEGIPTKYNHEGKNKITVRAMHGPGKTFGVAGIMHWFNWCFQGLIVCTAPKEKQLKTRLWPTFRKIRSRAGGSYAQTMKVDSTKIVWCNDEDWAAHAETASEPENLAGYHNEHLLFIVDEASGIKEDMYPVIEGAVSTGYLVIIILIGNPTKNVGTFHDSHQRPTVAKNYYRIHVSLDKTTRVNKDWVKQMRDKYGEQSPVYQVRCLGNFAAEDKNQLISLEWLENAKNRDDEENGELWYLRISIDVSDGGEDETIFKVAKVYPDTNRRHFLKMYRKSYPTSVAIGLGCDDLCRIADEFEYNVKRGDDVVIDGLGVGAGFASNAIQGHKHPDKDDIIKFTTLVYKGGEASDDPKSYRNRRVQSYISYRDAIKDNRITFDEDFCDDDDWEEFCAQMCSIRTKPGIEKVEDLVTKTEMINQGLKSPDMGDAGAMQLADIMPTQPVQFDEIYISQTSALNNYDGGLA